MRHLVLAICVAACGGDDDGDASGDYMISVTNRANGCEFGNWTVDASSNGTVTVTQNNTDVTAAVTGLGAIALEAAIGGHVFTGKISGTTLDLNLLGTRSNNTGNCTYTFNAEIHAVLDGDVLTGQIDYSAATNGNPDCTGISDCRSFQDFNGTRPPS